VSEPVAPTPADPGSIPVLTDAVGREGAAGVQLNAKALQSALIAELLKLADSLLHQAAKDMEATLFEHVFDRLRAQLPEIVDRVVRDQTLSPGAGAGDDD